jgi:hypothetical protein
VKLGEKMNCAELAYELAQSGFSYTLPNVLLDRQIFAVRARIECLELAIGDDQRAGCYAAGRISELSAMRAVLETLLAVREATTLVPAIQRQPEADNRA